MMMMMMINNYTKHLSGAVLDKQFTNYYCSRFDLFQITIMVNIMPKLTMPHFDYFLTLSLSLQIVFN